MARLHVVLQTKRGKRLAGHGPGGHLGEGHADDLAHVGHRAARARVHLQDEDLALVDRELHVVQAHDVQ